MDRKFFYYIGVQTDKGLVLVTSIANKDKMAVWNIDEKPKAFPKSVAEDIAEGLCMNMFVAVVVRSFFELSEQFAAPLNKTTNN